MFSQHQDVQCIIKSKTMHLTHHKERTMNLKQLRHIVAVADTLNFHRASERVFLTQSALSRSVANFEKDIGLKIFDRTNAKVSITYVGQQILTRARALLNESHNLQQQLKNIHLGEDGEVNFGMGPFLAATIIPSALKRYHLEHPNITFNIQINDWQHLRSLLEDEKIEFFIADVRQITDSPDLLIRLLKSPQISFYCYKQHPLYQAYGNHKINPKQLLTYPLASVGIPSVVIADIKRALNLSAENFKISIQCDDILLLKNLLPDTEIILLSANHMISLPQDHEHFKMLNVSMKNKRFGTWGLVTLKGRDLSPAAEALCNQLCNHILEID